MDSQQHTETVSSVDQRHELCRLPRQELEQHQLRRLNGLLARILPDNRFYRDRLQHAGLPIRELSDLTDLPFTTKDNLVAGDADGVAANLTWNVGAYNRFHRTSGTRGQPLTVLDTAEDWRWWIETWQFVLDSASVQPSDRLFLAFSFGPFIGFWSAFDAAATRGALCIPAGGMSSLARLKMIISTRSTVLLCTPSYSLHLAELAKSNEIDIANSAVNRIIVAGEPGGSLPAVRDLIQSRWNASVIDHAGASEIGPWGFSDSEGRGLHVVESEFIAEFESVESGGLADENELSELIITGLGRAGCPVVRYRTGDLVRPVWNHGLPTSFVLLEGGILGRVDDMMIIRGVNVFPSSIEQIVRTFPEIEEFRMVAFRSGQMDQIRIDIEDHLESPDRVADELQVKLGLRVEIQRVPVGSLPRFEMKNRRFVDERKS